jgi:hypothetical protein
MPAEPADRSPSEPGPGIGRAFLIALAFFAVLLFAYMIYASVGVETQPANAETGVSDPNSETRPVE